MNLSKKLIMINMENIRGPREEENNGNGKVKKEEAGVKQGRIKEELEKITNKATELGAKDARVILPKNIFIEEKISQKCLYGCKGYGNFFTCPPYTKTPEETRKIINEYNVGLLVRFSDLREKEEQKKVHEIMFKLEREAFLDGFEMAFAYTAGPCRICYDEKKTPEENRGYCKAEKIENPNIFSKKHCKNPKQARPCMEGSGINVFETASNAGYKIEIIRNRGEPFQSFGLLMLG